MNYRTIITQPQIILVFDIRRTFMLVRFNSKSLMNTVWKPSQKTKVNWTYNSNMTQGNFDIRY